MIGLELYLEGASHRIFRSLNYLGVTQGVDVTRKHADSVRTHSDARVIKWKLDKELEVIKVHINIL